MNWNKFGFVIASKYRKKIVIQLLERPKSPKELADEIKIYMSHVSLTLKELSNKQIVSCLTPERNKGRIYGLTKVGEEIAKKL